LNIVRDTNCLIQILPRLSEHGWLYELILQGKINLAVTTDILNEYEEVLDTFFESSWIVPYRPMQILLSPTTGTFVFCKKLHFQKLPL